MRFVRKILVGSMREILLAMDSKTSALLSIAGRFDRQASAPLTLDELRTLRGYFDEAITEMERLNAQTPERPSTPE